MCYEMFPHKVYFVTATKNASLVQVPALLSACLITNNNDKNISDSCWNPNYKAGKPKSSKGLAAMRETFKQLFHLNLSKAAMPNYSACNWYLYISSVH
jgi:hypothetical protein